MSLQNQEKHQNHLFRQHSHGRQQQQKQQQQHPSPLQQQQVVTPQQQQQQLQQPQQQAGLSRGSVVAMQAPQLLYAKYRSPSLPVNSFSSVELPANVQPISTRQMGELMEGAEDDAILVVDVRPYAQYAASRIRGAINVCIPSTLLKRQTYALHRFAECMVPSQKERLLNVGRYQHIVLYDGSTTDFAGAPSSHASLLHTMLKFAQSPDVEATVYYLKGGMAAFETAHKALVDMSKVNTIVPVNTLNLPPVKTGFDTSNASPFEKSFREDYDYCDETSISINVPDNMSKAQAEQVFPRWLADLVGSEGPKLVARRFHNIEQAEKFRLRNAFTRETKQNGQGHTSNRQSPRISFSAGMESGYKNRYNNIWPYDHTRVVLSGVDCNSCDYINASYISSELSSFQYIATQAPLPDTFKDFWKVAWDERIPVIVSLSAVSEGGQIKCDEYWGSKKYKAGRFWVQVVEEKEQRLADDTDTQVTLRKFRLSQDGDLVKYHDVVQIHYTSWPDLGSPASPQDLLALCRLKGAVIDAYCKENPNAPHNGHPRAIVHCSAGCGRTGAFCTVDSVIDIASRGKASSNEDLIFNVVNDFRTQRLSMVQSLRQYALCYEAAMCWYKRTYDNQEA